MSNELEQAKDIALSALRQHPQSILLPYYRWAIYMALGPPNTLHTRFCRVRLALLSAKKAHCIWQDEMGDAQVESIIELAEKVLRDEVLREVGRAQVEEALDHLNELATIGKRSGSNKPGNRAQSAMAAAIEALSEASGYYVFASKYYADVKTDVDLDPWTTDAALYASNALAGAVWDIVQDCEARKQFWEWWLLEAIPSLYISRNEGC